MNIKQYFLDRDFIKRLNSKKIYIQTFDEKLFPCIIGGIYEYKFYVHQIGGIALIQSSSDYYHPIFYWVKSLIELIVRQKALRLYEFTFYTRSFSLYDRFCWLDDSQLQTVIEQIDNDIIIVKR